MLEINTFLSCETVHTCHIMTNTIKLDTTMDVESVNLFPPRHTFQTYSTQVKNPSIRLGWTKKHETSLFGGSLHIAG